jgi:hypothetical protein
LGSIYITYRMTFGKPGTAGLEFGSHIASKLKYIKISTFHQASNLLGSHHAGGLPILCVETRVSAVVYDEFFITNRFA